MAHIEWFSRFAEMPQHSAIGSRRIRRTFADASCKPGTHFIWASADSNVPLTWLSFRSSMTIVTPSQALRMQLSEPTWGFLCFPILPGDTAGCVQTAQQSLGTVYIYMLLVPHRVPAL